MLVTSGPDAASRAALRLLAERLPGMSTVEGGASADLVTPGDPPTLRSAQMVEGSSLRAIKIPNLSRQAISEFGAFLDGAQKVQVVGHHQGVPIVFGTVSAAVRVRVDRRMITWGHEAPRVKRRIFLPLKYLPALKDLRGPNRDASTSLWRIVDPSTADRNGDYPSQHPAVLLERAIRAVDQERERLGEELAEAWLEGGEGPVFIGGGISRGRARAARRRSSSTAASVAACESRPHPTPWV